MHALAQVEKTSPVCAAQNLKQKRVIQRVDLRAFTKERNAEIEARTGGPYETHFLEGKDLEGSDQLNDPDLQSRSYRSGCS